MCLCSERATTRVHTTSRFTQTCSLAEQNDIPNALILPTRGNLLLPYPLPTLTIPMRTTFSESKDENEDDLMSIVDETDDISFAFDDFVFIANLTPSLHVSEWNRDTDRTKHPLFTTQRGDTRPPRPTGTSNLSRTLAVSVVSVVILVLVGSLWGRCSTFWSLRSAGRSRNSKTAVDCAEIRLPEFEALVELETGHLLPLFD